MGNACGSEKSVQTADQSKRPTEKPANSSSSPAKNAEKKDSTKGPSKKEEKKQTRVSSGKKSSPSSGKVPKPKNLDLYLFPGSAVCRAVMMTCAAAKIEYNAKCIDVFKGEHKSPEFLKINPEHTLPTMCDDGFMLTESRPIMIYLLSKYAPDSSLYPADHQKRAIVDRFLAFDCGTLAPCIKKHVEPVYMQGKGSIDDIKKALCPVLEHIDNALSKCKYLAGDCLTIADFAIYSSFGYLWLAGYDFTVHPNICKWKECLMQLPYYKECNKGLMELKQMLEKMKAACKPENLELHVALGSAPCRALMMACAHAGIEYKCCEIDLAKGDHMKPEFLKINPRHKVPTINDNGFIMDESRPALIYLMSRYAPMSGLYPRDIQKRALVDKWLCYDQGTLYPAVGAYVYPMLLRGEPLSEEMKKKVCTVLDFVNSHLEGRKYLVGDCPTIADISMVASLSMLYLADCDISPWKNVYAHFMCFKEQPYFKEANRGLMGWKEKLKNAGGATTSGKNPEVMPMAATGGVAPMKSDKPTLYWNCISPYARAAMATMKMSGIDFVSKEIDLMKGEHKTPEYLAMNPMGQVPTLVDGDFCMGESRPIMMYVMDKYCPDHSLYPCDVQKRAVINKWLSYDHGTFASQISKHVLCLAFGDGNLDQANEEALCKTFEFFDENLGKCSYVCGEDVTLPDITMYCEVEQIAACGYDFSKYKNICAWRDKLAKGAGECEGFAKGMKMFEEMVKAKKAARASGPCLYMDWKSPNARQVYSGLKMAGVNFTTKEIDLMKGEHKGEEYLKINPQGAVPALKDGDLLLSESRPILMYCLSKYAPNCSLYPCDDLQKRAKVDQWLSYDHSTWNAQCVSIVFPKLFKGEQPSQEKLDKLNTTMQWVDSELASKPYVCGDTMTIADVTMHGILSQLLVTDHDISAHTNICDWCKRMEEANSKFPEVAKAIDMLKAFYKSKSS